MTTETNTSQTTNDPIKDLITASIETKGSVAEPVEERPGLLTPPSEQPRPDLRGQFPEKPWWQDHNKLLQVIDRATPIIDMLMKDRVNERKLAWSFLKRGVRR